ncbi:hypothetical protein EVAR_43573_1 [Eumeta japonica]|uniref:Uncharacterized protein n=1 Tax=Eumeta variegata TaxID=151549 RepID=A0A4C1XCR3_EUMVA|nr:hypothetical protein EVAR_43573_1 [Eumeta japonica]
MSHILCESWRTSGRPAPRSASGGAVKKRGKRKKSYRGLFFFINKGYVREMDAGECADSAALPKGGERLTGRAPAARPEHDDSSLN